VRDDLLTWLRVRAEVPWASAASPAGPGGSGRDGFDAFLRTLPAARADRLRPALNAARRDAAAGGPLTFELLASWQTIVLGVPSAPFRTGPAFAKGGRERYGLQPDTERRFRAGLAQATDPSVPLPGRAARAYLDVAFFHPFTDGNGRAGMLTLAYLLARDHITIDVAEPLLIIPRRADDPSGAAGLAHDRHPDRSIRHPRRTTPWSAVRSALSGRGRPRRHGPAVAGSSTLARTDGRTIIGATPRPGGGRGTRR
jgi:hypothetical protein